MVIHANIARKSEETKRKNTWSVQIFKYGNEYKYSHKIKKLALTICNDVRVLLTWSVRISEYGNQ
jgi:hypothetical protein